jgi:hypothetical protein
MDNPETLVALSTQDTGQINVKKNRGDNQEMLTVSLDFPFLVVPSVFSNVYLSYVLCTQC